MSSAMLALFFAARKQGLFLDKIYNSMAALTAHSFEKRLKKKGLNGFKAPCLSPTSTEAFSE
jgi:hypothetical protein